MRKEEFYEAILQIGAKEAPGKYDIPPRAKIETEAVGYILPQLLYREVAPDLEGGHHLVHQLTGETTLLQAS